MRRILLTAWLALAMALAVGCAGRHFHEAAAPPPPEVRFTLDTMPCREYWTGILFNSRRIGFTHFAIRPSKTRPGSWEIRSEAFMSFRFLMMEKNVSLFSVDVVDRDLRLLSFSCDYLVDSSALRVDGEVTDGVLTVRGASGSTGTESREAMPGDLYPSSAACLYPLLHGLGAGKKYAYKVYDSETRQVTDISQQVLAYEESDLFRGPAFRVSTRYLGQDITTWMNDQGLPVFESALGGAMVSRLEGRDQARDYLVQSSLNKRDSLLEFSLVKVDGPIPSPERVTDLEVRIEGIPEDLALISDGRQTFTRGEGGVLCAVRSLPERAGDAPREDIGKYLKSSMAVPGGSPRISSLAAQITAGKASGRSQAVALLDWIRSNIRREPVDVFSALDVLDGKKAECQGHAYLYAALARSLGIPTRVANGLVYSGDFQGFLYHSWDESLIDGAWAAVDPTMHQLPADATHIKLVEGDELASLAPLTGVIGRIRIQVVRAR